MEPYDIPIPSPTMRMTEWRLLVPTLSMKRLHAVSTTKLWGLLSDKSDTDAAIFQTSAVLKHLIGMYW